jgi:hypothetical protein
MIHTDGRPTIVSDSRENREFAEADDRKTVEAEAITAQAVEVPPHLRGSISPEEWTQICKEDADAEEGDNECDWGCDWYCSGFCGCDE